MILISSYDDNFDALIDRLSSYGRATETIIADLRVPQTAIALFIDEDDSMSVVSKYRVKQRVVTNRKIVEFSNPLALSRPLPIDYIMDKLLRHRARINQISRKSGLQRVTPALSREIVQLLAEFDRGFSEWLEAGLRESQISIDYYPAARLEYDAIALPLKMAGFTDVQFESGSDRRVGVFGQLAAENMNEEQILTHDISVMNDPRLWNRDSVYGKTFYSADSGSRVEIIYSNRTPLERVLGVDLLIHNVDQHSVIMVQYKRMIREQEQFVYRTDKQFDA